MANEAHLKKLKEGVEAWNEWREANIEITPDLSKANLQGADLSGTYLDDTNFSGANLREAKLYDSTLRAVNLINADLRGADLRRANLGGAMLSKADLRGANLTEAKLIDDQLVLLNINAEANLSKANLSGVKLCRANLNEVNFKEAILSGADLSGANLVEADLEAASLVGARLYGANLSEVNLVEADLRRTNFWGANLTGANLSRANLTGSNLWEANLTGASLIDADLSEALLITTKALAVNFKKAKLTGACVDDWHINRETNFDSVICKYVYRKYDDLRKEEQERCPHGEKFFAPGEFTKLFQEARDIVDLIFHNSVEWDAFAFSYKKLLIENEDLHFDIKTIDNRDGVLVVTVQGIPEAYQGKWQSAFWQRYDLALQALEAKYQSELRAKDGQIVLYERMSSQHEKTINQQAGFIDQLIKLLDNPVLRDINIDASQNSSIITNTTTQSVMSEAPKYDMRGSNFPGGFAETNYGKMVETQYNIMSQDLPKAADQIQQRLGQLIQTHKYTPEDAKHKVASDLAQEVQSNPTLKQKLMKLLQYVRGAAASGLIGEATVEVIKLALNAVGMPVP